MENELISENNPVNKRRGFNLNHFLILLATVIFVTFISLRYSLAVLQLTLIEVFFLFFLLLLTLLPLGKTKLGGDSAQRTSFWSWFCYIVVIQLGAYLIWLGIATPLLATTFGVSAADQSSSLFLISFVGSLVFQGLHPWSLVALLTVAIGVIGYCYQQEKISGAVRVLITREVPPSFFSAIDIVATASIVLFMFVYSAIAIFGIFMLVHYFVPYIELSVQKANSVLPVMVLGIILSHLYWTKRLRSMTAKQQTLGTTVFLIIGLSCCVLIGFDVLMSTLPPESQQALQAKINSKLILNENIQAAWLLIFWSLGILSTPLLAVWMANLSRGRSVRQVILVILAMPLFSAVFFHTLGQQVQVKIAPAIAIFQWISKTTQGLFSEPIVYYVPLLSLIVFLGALSLNTELNHSLIQMTANLAGKNMRRFRKLFITISPFVAWSLLIFLIAGIVGLQYFLTLMAIAVFIFCIPLPLLALMKVSIKPKKYLVDRHHK